MATQSYEQLISGANKIRQNELPESNTAALVGEQLLQMVNKQQEESRERVKGITEYNVSVHHPTSGTGGTNRYTLETAIVQVPPELRNIGLKVSFINSDGKVETWEFQGGTFTDVEWVKNGNWEQIPNQKQLNELDKNINSLTFSYDEGVGIVNSKGDIDKSYTSFNYKVTPVYKCKSGDIFKYKGRGEGQGASVIFYSGNKAVSSIKINNVKDFVDIVIENGVDGVKFASINNVGAGDVILSVRSRYFLTKEDDLFSLSDKTDAQIKDLEATANNATDKVDSLNSNVQDLQRTTTFVVDIEKGIGFIQENGDPNPVAQNMRYKKTNRITCFKDDIFQYKGHQEGQSVSYLF